MAFAPRLIALVERSKLWQDVRRDEEPFQNVFLETGGPHRDRGGDQWYSCFPCSGRGKARRSKNRVYLRISSPKSAAQEEPSSHHEQRYPSRPQCHPRAASSRTETGRSSRHGDQGPKYGRRPRPFPGKRTRRHLAGPTRRALDSVRKTPSHRPPSIRGFRSTPVTIRNRFHNRSPIRRRAQDPGPVSQAPVVPPDYVAPLPEVYPFAHRYYPRTYHYRSPYAPFPVIPYYGGGYGYCPLHYGGIGLRDLFKPGPAPGKSDEQPQLSLGIPDAVFEIPVFRY